MALAASDQLLEAFAAGFWKVSREPVYLAIGAWPLDTRWGPTGKPVFFGRMSCMHTSAIAKQFKLMLLQCTVRFGSMIEVLAKCMQNYRISECTVYAWSRTALHCCYYY